MKQSFQFFFRIIFVLCSQTVFSQDENNGQKKVCDGVQIYLDYGKLLTYFSEFESKYELGLIYQFKNKFQPNIHFGSTQISPKWVVKNGNYISSGTYWKFGVNYLMMIDTKNALYVGLKYGESRFVDSLTYRIDSKFWDAYKRKYDRNHMRASWYEVLIGTENKIMRHLLIGGQFGFRSIIQTVPLEFIDFTIIPGYGLSKNKNPFFLNLFIKYVIKDKKERKESD